MFGSFVLVLVHDAGILGCSAVFCSPQHRVWQLRRKPLVHIPFIRRKKIDPPPLESAILIRACSAVVESLEEEKRVRSRRLIEGRNGLLGRIRAIFRGSAVRGYTQWR